MTTLPRLAQCKQKLLCRSIPFYRAVTLKLKNIQSNPKIHVESTRPRPRLQMFILLMIVIANTKCLRVITENSLHFSIWLNPITYPKYNNLNCAVMFYDLSFSWLSSYWFCSCNSLLHFPSIHYTSGASSIIVDVGI